MLKSTVIKSCCPAVMAGQTVPELEMRNLKLQIQ